MANAVSSHNSEPIFTRQLPNVEANGLLRIPQREAYLAAKQHFQEDPATPAVLQLPMGCGKTGVISMLPFGLAKKRVLVIAPNVVIRDGLASALNVSNAECFWRRFGIFPVQPELVVTSSGATREVHDSFTGGNTGQPLPNPETGEITETEVAEQSNRKLPRSPQEERQAVRREVHSETQRRVMEILRDLRLQPFGWQIQKHVPGVPKTKNYLAIRMLFIRELRRAASIPAKKKRDDWTLEETIMAYDTLLETDTKIRNLVQTHLRRGVAKRWEM